MCKMTVPCRLLCLACRQSGASCDVSLGFSWGGGSQYWAWHHQDTVGSGSFLWNLASPMTAFSEVWTQSSTDMSWYTQVQAAGTDFLTCLIFRVQNPSGRTLNQRWAWGSSWKKNMHNPSTWRAGYGCLFSIFYIIFLLLTTSQMGLLARDFQLQTVKILVWVKMCCCCDEVIA